MSGRPFFNKKGFLPRISVILAAVDGTGVIGVDKRESINEGNRRDMIYFKKITTTTSGEDFINAVVQGHDTWRSIPTEYKPLPKRLNVVLTHDTVSFDKEWASHGVLSYSSYNDAMISLGSMPNIDKIFVIGGAMVYEEALKSPRLERIYLTRLMDPTNLLKGSVFVDPKLLFRKDYDELEVTEENSVFMRKGIPFHFQFETYTWYLDDHNDEDEFSDEGEIFNSEQDASDSDAMKVADGA